MLIIPATDNAVAIIDEYAERAKFSAVRRRPDDDHDVFDGERRIDRIMLATTAPRDRPWSWITARVPRSPAGRGYATTRG